LLVVEVEAVVDRLLVVEVQEDSEQTLQVSHLELIHLPKLRYKHLLQLITQSQLVLVSLLIPVVVIQYLAQSPLLVVVLVVLTTVLLVVLVVVVATMVLMEHQIKD
jgi:hypothetical protein